IYFYTRGEYVHRFVAEIREAGQQLIVYFGRRRTYGNPIGSFTYNSFQTIGIILGWIVFADIVVLGIVSCCMDQKNIFFLSIFYSLVYSVFVINISFTKTHVDDFSTVFYRITNAIGYIFITFIPI